MLSRAHGEAERRIVDTFYKTKICKYWKDQGSCIRGAECYFGKTFFFKLSCTIFPTDDMVF